MNRFITQENLKIIVFVVLTIIITFFITKHIYTIDDYMPRAKINNLEQKYGRDIVNVQDYIKNNTLDMKNYLKDITEAIESEVRDDEYLKCKAEINDDNQEEASHGSAKLTKSNNE